LQEQQEVMADLADMITQVYALESALLRARKLAEAKRGTAEVAAAMTGCWPTRPWDWPSRRRGRVLAACAEGDLLRTQLAILRRLARFTPADAVGLSRTVARQESRKAGAGGFVRESLNRFLLPGGYSFRGSTDCGKIRFVLQVAPWHNLDLCSGSFRAFSLFLACWHCAIPP
jgi:hypothetical protein